MPTPNFIKYSTTPDDKSIKVGNYSIGVASGTTYGPTSGTSYWSGISPPTSGYTIYENKVTNGPSIRVPSSSAVLIDYANRLYSGSSITTEAGALTYFNSLNTVICVNRNYEEIVTSGLTVNLDAGFTPSYPKSGTSWTDLSFSGNNGTLTNGPTYSSSNGGTIVFDGTNDYVQISNNVSPGTGDFAISVWVYKTETVTNRYIWDFGANGGTLASGTSKGPGFRYYNPTIGTGSSLYTSGPILNINTWYNIVISRISGTTYFYSNGSLIVSAADAGNIGSWGTTLYIGRYGGGGGYEHQGSISNFLVYKNKGLTAAEVSQNFNAQKSRFGL